MSVTISGLLVIVLSAILRALGVEFGSEEVTQVVNLTLEVAGLVVAWYGRYRQGDVTVVGVKKP